MHGGSQGCSLEIVTNETFNPTDGDMTPQLIKNHPGVDVLLVGGFGQSLALVTRNYGQLGMKVPLYHAHGAASRSSSNWRAARPKGFGW